MSSRNVIDPGRHIDAEPRNVRRIDRQIGAHVGDNVELEPEETALVVDGQPRGRDVVAAVAVGEEVLGALADPLTGLRRLRARDRGKRIFAIGKQLGAKAATDIGRDDAHLFRRQFHHAPAMMSRMTWLPWLPSVSVSGRRRYSAITPRVSR